jgi:succinate dehydrogenase / fumarate reductase, flavoprotein subunit
MWETCGVVRDQAGLRRGLERVAELRELAREVDVRPTSEGYADLAHALDLRASLVAAEASLLGALARTESRGAHQRRDHPRLDPDLQVNFRSRADADRQLVTTADPVPPVPPDLRPWVDATGEVSVAGRLLE